jgi:hypothetical protein
VASSGSCGEPPATLSEDRDEIAGSMKDTTFPGHEGEF